jgi:hypothetical protein
MSLALYGKPVPVKETEEAGMTACVKVREATQRRCPWVGIVIYFKDLSNRRRYTERPLL